MMARARARARMPEERGAHDVPPSNNRNLVGTG